MKAAISATQDVREQNVSGCSSELHIGLLFVWSFSRRCSETELWIAGPDLKTPEGRPIRHIHSPQTVD